MPLARILVSAMLLGAVLGHAGPAQSQSVPPDLEVIATSAGLAPGGENVTVRITADGQGRFTRYAQTAGPTLLEDTPFTLTTPQLQAIWNAIQSSGFLGLAPNTSNPAIADGALARVIVRANGTRYDASARNVAVDAIAAVLAAINAETPGALDVEYRPAEPVSFSPQDICPLDVTPTAASPDVKSEGVIRSFARSAESEAHAGTTVATPLSLDTAAFLGMVTLTAKGGYFGDRVSITVNNNGLAFGRPVRATLSLEFYGPGATEANAARIKSAIESYWHGTLSDGRPFETKVETLVRGNVATPPGTPSFHQIRLETTPVAHSPDFVADLKPPNQGVTSGTWYMGYGDAIGIPTYAHEAGHLLGIDDRYDDFRKQPDGSWKRQSDDASFTTQQVADRYVAKITDEDPVELATFLANPAIWRWTVPTAADPLDLMASGPLFGTHVEQSDLDTIAASAGVEVEVRPGDVLLNRLGDQQNLTTTRSADIFAAPGQSRTLDGLYVACIDLHDAPPHGEARFDVGPRLDTWTAIAAGPELLRLLRYIDAQQLYCPDITGSTQSAIWRITDNHPTLPQFDHADAILASAGIDTAARTFDFPRLANDTPADAPTQVLRPPEVPEPDTRLALLVAFAALAARRLDRAASPAARCARPRPAWD